VLDGWRRARAGKRQVIAVRGEAGIGKSALVEVLKEQVANDGGLVVEGDCSPHYQNSAFYAVAQALARWIGLASTDLPTDRQRMLEATLAALSLTDAAATPLIARLLAMPVDTAHPIFQLAAERQRARTLSVLLEIPPALARVRPVLLLIEDLHWADPSTLEFLRACVSQPEGSNVLIALTARPEFTADWLGQSGVNRVELGGLDTAGAEQLVNRTLGGKTLPAEVARQIVQRADGVPLFIEETTREIVESNLLQDAGDHFELNGPLPATLVPMSLQDALMARLDRLETARGLVQIGATIGREFSYELLCAVYGDDGPVLSEQLERAVASGLLHQHGTPPKATFVFKHALVQETAYQSLLRKTRQQYHQRVAAALENQFRETTEQKPELLAHHHTEAGNVAKAIPYWRTAAGCAITRAAFPEAVSHLTRALQLIETLSDDSDRDHQELALQSELGMTLQARRGYAAPEVDRAYTRARLLCQRVGTAEELLSVSRGQTRFYIARADYRTAAALGNELLRVGAENRSLEHTLEGHLALGVDLIYLGRFVESRRHFEQSLALLTPDTEPPPTFQYSGHSSSWSRSYLGRTLSFLGYYVQALEASKEGLAVAQRVAIPLSVAQGMGMLTNLFQMRRDIVAAQEWAARTIAFSTEYGFLYWSSLGAMVEGWILGHQRQVDQGVARLRQGLDRNFATGAKVGCSWFLVMLAELYQISGQWDQGLQAVTQALAHAESTDERYYEAEAYRLNGELLTAQHGIAAADAAEACFRRAIDVARQQSAKAWELRASTSLARLWREQHRVAEAQHLLTGIYEWFKEGHDVSDLQEARKLLGELTLAV
jgi:predicted ATPase